MKRLVDYVNEKLGYERDVRTTVGVIMYELGSVVQQIWKYDMGDCAYRANIKADIGDLMAQLTILCEQLGISAEECYAMGFDRLVERMTDPTAGYKKYEVD